ncbi:pyrroline-5-carboxylate reductase [Clostridia bacterium]|nr:pyrroline-5-carboxylate reductase [Clostridia bacterium]
MSIENNVGFIGVGNMGLALLKGYTAAQSRGVQGGASAVYAYDRDAGKASVVASCGAVFATSEAAVVAACKYVIIACKPQQIDALIAAVAPALTEQTVLISICAGLSEAVIKAKIAAVAPEYSAVANTAKVVLVMPNTPAILNKGASAVARGSNVSSAEFDFARGVIASCGIALEVPADKMNEIIPVNGSSPAFIYLYAQYFIDYATSQGIDEATATQLFAMSLIGAGEMILHSGNGLDTLIQQVSSPGGTTVAGLAALRERGLDTAVRAGCEACAARARELVAG